MALKETLVLPVLQSPTMMRRDEDRHSAWDLLSDTQSFTRRKPALTVTAHTPWGVAKAIKLNKGLGDVLARWAWKVGWVL